MSSETLPPWLSPWAPGLVYGHRVHQQPPVNERGRHRPRLTVYTYGHGNSAPVIRFSSWSESVDNPGGAGGALRWERVPLQHSAWHDDEDAARTLDRPSPYDASIHSGMDLTEGEEGGEDSSLEAWGGVLRGWACGAALLLLLLMLLRLGEYFGEWKALMRRRRLHRQRANVRANSRVESQPTAIVEPPAACNVELPPPYSTCGAPSAPASAPAPASAASAPGPKDEEPPPTYSDCVEFFNKNGITTFMFNRENDLGVSNRGREPKGERSEGQRHVEVILRPCGIDIAAPGKQTTSQTTNSIEINVDSFGRVNVLANRDVDDAPNLNGDVVIILSADDSLNDANIDPSNNMVSPNDTHAGPNDTTADPDHGIDPNDEPKRASAYRV